MSSQLDFRSLRILIVGGKPHSVRILRTVLGLAGISRIVSTPDAASGLKQLTSDTFDAVFCDELTGELAGMSFAVAARRSPEVVNNMVPIFLTCSGPRRREVEAARNEGITDVIARPISAATVMRKISGALMHPRSFIVAPTFFGPDRRGNGRSSYAGEDRRGRKARKVKIAKADLTYL